MWHLTNSCISLCSILCCSRPWHPERCQTTCSLPLPLHVLKMWCENMESREVTWMGNREKEHIPALILHSPATHSFFLRQRLLWQQQHHLYGLGIILCESYLTCFLLIHLRIPDQGLRRWDPSILTGTRLKMSIHTALQYKHLLSNRELHCSWLHNSC